MNNTVVQPIEIPSPYGMGVEVPDWMPILGVVIVLLYLLILAVGIVDYVLSSIGIHGLGKRRGVSYPWLAWIPVARSRALGAIADEYDGQRGLKKRWGITLLTLSIICTAGFVIAYSFFVIMMISLAGSVTGEEETIALVLLMYIPLLVIGVIGIVQTICSSICVYKIFESTVPEKSLLYLILYLIVPLAGSICLFSCRTKGYPFVQESPPVYQNIE